MHNGPLVRTLLDELQSAALIKYSIGPERPGATLHVKTGKRFAEEALYNQLSAEALSLFIRIVWGDFEPIEKQLAEELSPRAREATA